MAVSTRTKTWNSGDVLTAADLNAEFDHLMDALALTNSDIASGAGIVYSKLSMNNSIPESDLLITDNTTKDVSTSAHGFVPKAPNSTTQYLRGDGTWATLVINRAFTWFLDGTEVVRNEAGAKYIVPQSLTAVKIWYQCNSGTATIRIQKDTTDVVNSLSVSSTQGSTTSFSAGTLTAGQVLSLDITAASSPIGITVTMECTQ